VTVAQTWDPARYRETGGFVATLGAGVVDLLAPQPGERILDVGCGDGTLTAEIAARGAKVSGIDSSTDQVAAARALGLDARRLDVLELQEEGVYDAVFSNAALHWVTKPERAIERIFRALKPGGRFVGEMGGKDNVHLVSRAILAALDDRGLDGTSAWPWFFPSDAAYSSLLGDAGFDVLRAELFERPTPLPGRFADWVEVFARPFLELVPKADRPGFLNDVETQARADLFDPSSGWTADYVRLRFVAIKPGGDA